MNNYHIYKQLQELADVDGQWGLKDVISLYRN